MYTPLVDGSLVWRITCILSLGRCKHIILTKNTQSPS
nr:MAG TPA: hypothetical protein [Caudoviricetes sp.]